MLSNNCFLFHNQIPVTLAAQVDLFIDSFYPVQYLPAGPELDTLQTDLYLPYILFIGMYKTPTGWYFVDWMLASEHVQEDVCLPVADQRLLCPIKLQSMHPSSATISWT